jgi:hypothetical protein
MLFTQQAQTSLAGFDDIAAVTCPDFVLKNADYALPFCVSRILAKREQILEHAKSGNIKNWSRLGQQGNGFCFVVATIHPIENGLGTQRFGNLRRMLLAHQGNVILKPVQQKLRIGA